MNPSLTMTTIISTLERKRNEWFESIPGIRRRSKVEGEDEEELQDAYGEYAERCEERLEVTRRLPPLKNIEDGLLYDETVTFIADHCPDYFWEWEASANHHHPSHREGRGLWLHTLRTAVVYERLVESPLQMGAITEKEADYGRIACLLHDMFKYGPASMPHEHTVSYHDRLAAAIVKEHTELPYGVVRAIDTHNGPWYDGDEPFTDLEYLHHYADMVASDPNVRIAVPDAPEELIDQFGEEITEA